MLYLITYDLREPETRGDYDRIATALRALGAKKVLLSTWMLTHANTTCVQIRDHLKKVMDGNDRLLVVAVSDWASWNAMTDINAI